MSIHINYIKDHLEAISEKKKQQTLEIINSFSEIKENNSINKTKTKLELCMLSGLVVTSGSKLLHMA